jgi:predicted phosphodiesterase
MKILAIGDFHGKFPAKLKKEARKVDLILSTGDYAGIDEWRKEKS